MRNDNIYITNRFSRVILLMLFVVVFLLPASSVAFSESAVSVIINEKFINQVVSAISPVSCRGNLVKVEAKALGQKVDLVAVNYNWDLGDPVVKLRNGTAEITFRFHLDADVKPLGINPMPTKPEFSDTEKVTAKLSVIYQEGKLVLNPLETNYPIDVKLHISSKLRKDFNLFNLDISKLIPPIELPIPTGQGLEVSILSKSIKANATPVIEVRDGEIEVLIKKEAVEIYTQGVSVIPPQDQKIVKVDIDNAIAQTIEWAYEKQKDAIRKLQKELEEKAKAAYEEQKRIIAQQQKRAEKAAKKAYDAQKAAIKKIAFWEKW